MRQKEQKIAKSIASIIKYLVFFSFLFSIFLPLSSYAHKPSDSYLTLWRDGQEIHAQWDIALRDLDYAVGLDNNNDGEITWGELKVHHNTISDYALSQFMMKTNGAYCKNETIEHLVDKHSDGTYEVLHFKINCEGLQKVPKKFDLEYNLFFDLDPQHRGLLNIKHKGKTISRIFSPNNSTQHFNLDSQNIWSQSIDFLKEGIWHIWTGFDHILFLLALLLPSVLIRVSNTWKAVTSLKTAFWNIFKIVTAFTIAHSITLSLATLEIIQLPSRFVESIIALSVILAALNNIYPVFKEKRWLIAFVFGLIHGFGFASVLMDLGLPKDTLLIALLSFNVGVEVGQLVIVGAFIPFAYKLKESRLYQIIMLTGSIIIAVIALVWFIERAFNFSFFPIS